MGVIEIIIISVVSLGLVAVLCAGVYCEIRESGIEENVSQIYDNKYDKIYNKEKVMNKRERIERLEEEAEKLKQEIEQIRTTKRKIDDYSKSLVFLSNFKFEYIKNKVLREETKRHSHASLNVFCGPTTEQVIYDLYNYGCDVVIDTYNYIREQLRKDNELAIYNGKVKIKVVNDWSVGPVATAITYATTPYAEITKSKSKKKKKTPKKK